jgi:hypothetical protein
MLPKDPVFWIVVAICIAFVVALAIAFGRGLEIGKWYIRVKPARPGKGDGFTFGKKMKITGGKVGGDIAAIKQGSGVGSDIPGGNIDALRGARFRNVDVTGDIAGVKQEGDSGKKT